MKPKHIKILEKILKVMAQIVLWRHKPKIIAITGSVGKTSAKVAVLEVLSSKFYIRENQKNYNNEIGIPLTIIGAQSGGKNIFKWILVFIKWILVIIFSNFPEILVLELAVDRPNDMKYFMSFMKPTIAIVTNISSSHIEYFKTLEKIAKEKRAVVESLDEEGVAILNGDDEMVLQMGKFTKARILTYGAGTESKVNYSNLVYNYHGEKPIGISFKLNYAGKNIPIRLRNILAGHQVYSALAAICTGIVLKMNLVEISKALESLRSPAGRMNLLEGINDSYIIDDTYNASPVSTIAAIDVLKELKSKRKIAVLGDMLELGEQSEAGHLQVIQKICNSNIDLLITVGKRMNRAVDGLKDDSFSQKNILRFDDPIHASECIAKIIAQGDFILVKGSQGMRMEKIVEKLLKNSKDEQLLCRQSADWKKKIYLNP